MRLLSATVRNYRVHKSRTILFDPARTVIGGPNEVGKSTVAEAVHRALFLKSKGATQYHKDMVSHHGGHPEVEVEFEARGGRYLLVKRFGATGSTTLSGPGGQKWSGDGAEDRLLDLTGLTKDRGAGRDWAVRQWAHLWVWQGDSWKSPAEFAADHKDSLLQRLQQDGGATVLQSDLDSKAAAHFHSRSESLFTSRHTPKANTDLDTALKAEQKAADDLARARHSFSQLAEASQSVISADETLAHTTGEMERLESELLQVEADLSRITALEHQAQSEARDLKDAQTECDRLTADQKQLASLTQQISQLRAALEPEQAALVQRQEQSRQSEDALRAAEQCHEEKYRAATAARAAADLAAAHIDLLEKQALRATLLTRGAQINKATEALATIQAQLAALPNITPAQLKNLQALELQTSTAEATLAAMAARITVVATDSAITIDGRPLPVGHPEVITSPAELNIGGSRLRIEPGGGASLAEAKANAAELRAKLSAQLRSLDIASPAIGAEVLSQRQRLATEEKALLAELKFLSAPTFTDELAAAERDCLAAQARIQRHTTPGTHPQTPGSIETARTLAAEAERLRRAAESAESAQKAEVHAARHARDQLSATCRQAQEALAQRQQDLQTASVQHAFLIKTHGDEAGLSAKLTAAHETANAAAQRLRSTQEQIASLQPDLRQLDRNRLRGAKTKLETDRAEAENSRSAALALLRHVGSSNPEAELSLAQARLETIRHHRLHIERRANATKLLAHLFSAERAALTERFSRPFADRIRQYLACIFGHSVLPEVTLESDGSLAQLSISRPNPDSIHTSHQFDLLSAGTREQVAAAARLAMAEVLAADHDGCLPVLFDDAFAHSDATRTRALIRMLDLAASRGLQVIILTHTPTDYSALGARMVQL